MNKEIKKSFQDIRTSFGFPVAPFTLWPTKRTFSIGAFICISATAMAAIATSETPYQNARVLVASTPQQHTSSLSNDVYTLREQLLEKTKELQEYKAGLFRASHPQDQAKIVELNRRIAEHEKAKQELISKIKEIEEELLKTKKQMDSLTVSSNALTDYIKTQRATVEAEKKEMLAQIKAFEEDIKDEKKLNSKVITELAVLKAKMANYEMNIALVDQKHQNDLEDSLQETAMLKFELADTRRQSDMKEHALLVSTLNYLTMAQDHHEGLQNRHQSHKSKLAHSTQKLSTLKLTISELTQENERLQKENERLGVGRDLIDKHFAERHVLAERLMEKEEALLAAMAYHEANLAEQADEVKSLRERLSEEEAAKQELLSQKESLQTVHDLEKHVLENATATQSENMSNTLLSYQIAINDYFSELEQVQNKLAVEEALRLKLQEDHDALIQTYASEKEHLQAFVDQYKNNLSDADHAQSKSTENLQSLHEHLELESLQTNRLNEDLLLLKAELVSSYASIQQHKEEIEQLNQKLAQQQEARNELLKGQEELIEKHANDQTSFQTSLREKEDLIARLSQSKESIEQTLHEKEQSMESELRISEESIKHQIEHIADLSEKLAQLQELHDNLKTNHDELNSQHHIDKDSYGTILKKNEGVITELEQAKEKLEQAKEELELALYQKEEALKLALTSADDSVKHHLAQIAQLDEKLEQEKQIHQDLQKQYQELQSKHATETQSLETILHDKENAFSQLEQDKKTLEQALQEKEEALKTALMSADDSTKQHREQIAQLNEKLTQEQALHQDLQRNLDELHAKLEAETESFERSLKEKEDLIGQLDQTKRAAELAMYEKESSLKSAIAASEESERQHTNQINHLNEKQHETEQQYLSLENKYASLTAQLEDKKRELDANNRQLDALQQANDHLDNSLANAQSEISSIKNQLKHAEQISEKTAEELHSLHLDSAHDISVLKGQLSESFATIQDLKQEVGRLYADYRDKVEKEIELDRSIHALTVVAEHQDHALAQANSAFSLVQEYNQHLEAENKNLKNRLNSAEIAERSRSGNDPGNKAMIPPALFNLLKPTNN